jgi:hypothetical protein
VQILVPAVMSERPCPHGEVLRDQLEGAFQIHVGRDVTRCSRPRPQTLHRWRAFGCRQVDQVG